MTAADKLRPTNFDGYIGQEKMKAELQIRVKSALARNEAFPHTLLVGPAGSGKTTLAAIIGQMLGYSADGFSTFEMPFSDEDYRSLRESWGIIFLDEIHRATARKQEELLCMLEHNYIRPAGKSRIEWDEITIIGATTEPGKLIKPLRDRFLIQPFFDAYTDDEMATITKGMADKMGVGMSYEDCMILGKACAGVPRKASHFITAARDLAIGTDSIPTAPEVLAFMRHTEDGLSPSHVEYLKVLYRQSPCGLSAIKQMVDLDESGIIDLERLLVKTNFIEKTPKGRELAPMGYRRIKQILADEKAAA